MILGMVQLLVLHRFFGENHGKSLMKHAPKAIQKLVRFFKHPVVSNTQGKRLPQKKTNQWLDGKSTMNDFDE